MTIIPQIRGPIQLAGFLFSVFSAALIQAVNPNNVQSLVVVGAISVALISIPLLYRPEILSIFKPNHRPVVVLATLLILLISFGGLAAVTYKSVILTPKGARFDTSLSDEKVTVLGPRPDGKYRVQIIWNLFPISRSADESASVFIGMAVLHDDDLVKAAGIGQSTQRSCQEVESCLGYRVFTEYGKSPLLVKGGTSGTMLTTVIDIPRRPKRLRIWWEFYQREGMTEGEKCVVDHETPGVQDGIPPLAIYRGQDRTECYRSYGQRVIEL
ncbi:hypothetical protein H8N03_18560 [Ramlibacter sp. USB13]|uniref:Uncharacterized protein n=1 Tax=Ramlibacter cellulosilyticus TaxID=2764187 RepID=A0A923MTX8_9BURK|nr:hypothetical protein [Ramlibacter cellulosilyticus]MBC5784956.1 hypothetical protein [Ramlibacter cellulosilyticus]